MQKLYENFHISHFQKKIVSMETNKRNTVNKYILSVGMNVKVAILGTFFQFYYIKSPFSG